MNNEDTNIDLNHQITPEELYDQIEKAMNPDFRVRSLSMEDESKQKKELRTKIIEEATAKLPNESREEYFLRLREIMVKNLKFIPMEVSDGNNHKINFAGFPTPENKTEYISPNITLDFKGIPQVESIDSAVDFLKGTPYSANKGFTSLPMNTANQFDATEPPIVDFLKGSPYEVLKNFKPSPMTTPEQFDATEHKITFEGIPKAEINPASNVDSSIIEFLKNSTTTPFNYEPSPMPTPEQFEAAGKAMKDGAIKHMSKIRHQVGAISVDDNGKPKATHYAASERNYEQSLEPIDDKQYLPHAELGIASKKILEMREKSTENPPSTDNKNKPK